MFSFADNASRYQMLAADLQQAQTLYTTAAAQAQKHRAQRWQIMADLQTKIFEITQDVTVHKAKTADKAYDAWDKYVRG
ncbi:MAG: hypothetical protein HY319_11960 [Armatimonadetes bacterium]|nr:hypothetical protein [Armatimonadota bacterium]